MRSQRPGSGAVEDQILIEEPVACKSMAGEINTLCAAVAARVASARAGRESVDYAAVERGIDQWDAAMNHLMATQRTSVRSIAA
jgi:N-methylhydantoinase B/oxoprolinase/acetone carboxylase alpha subunit